MIKNLFVFFTTFLLISIGFFSFYEISKPIDSYTNNFYFETVDEYNLLYTEPLQTDLLKGDLSPYKNGKYNIKPIKRYQISAIILKIKEYKHGDYSTVLPLDFALGWNKMSNLDLIAKDNIKITQSNRFYFWRSPGFNNLHRKDIEHNSANVHIGAINNQVLDELKSLQENDAVYLEGFLVDITKDDSDYFFRTSLTRKDVGAGACEVFIVTKVKKLI